MSVFFPIIEIAIEGQTQWRLWKSRPWWRGGGECRPRLFVLVNWRCSVHYSETPASGSGGLIFKTRRRSGGSINVVFVNILSARNEKSCDFLWYAETRFAEWEIKGLHRDAWRVLLRFNAANDTRRREKNESQVFDVRFTWRHFEFGRIRADVETEYEINAILKYVLN